MLTSVEKIPLLSHLITKLHPRYFKYRYKTRVNYFKKKQFIFIHIPKNAGTSLSKSLGMHRHEHFTIAYYASFFDSAEFNSMYKFCIFRNPAERIVSAFNHVKRQTHYGDFRRYVQDHVFNQYSTVDEFILDWLNEKTLPTNYFTGTQQSFISINESLAVDDIFSFNHINEMMQVLQSKLPFVSPLVNLNISNTSPSPLSKPALDKLHQLYKNDYVIFNKVNALKHINVKETTFNFS